MVCYAVAMHIIIPMKKLFFALIIAAFTLTSVPALAATSVTKTTPTKTAVVAKKVVKKVVKKTVKKTSYGTSKNPVFSPNAAALAMGNVPGGAAYQTALRLAEKHCIEARGDKEKLAACDQEFKDAQALIGQ